MSEIKKRKVLKFFVFGVIILLIIMLLTAPSNQKYENWLSRTYNINCVYDGTNGRVCHQDDERIHLNSSHFQYAGLYNLYKQNYYYDNGERGTLRTLGVFGLLFKMKDNGLWELLN